MILRPYQEVAINSASKALDKHSNTIVVAPTGAGKTIMLSALIGERYKKNKNVLVLQHRDELVSQNSMKFNNVNPSISTSIVDGSQKDFTGNVVFSMVQTLSRDNNLNKMKPFDMLVIDESHHSAARTYKKVINKVINSEHDWVATISKIKEHPYRARLLEGDRIIPFTNKDNVFAQRQDLPDVYMLRGAVYGAFINRIYNNFKWIGENYGR